jgi:predicted dehydrogenase
VNYLFENYIELLAHDLEAVIICTPNHLHSRIAVEAANRGKHVLIEKPMALNPEEAQTIIDACDEAKVKLGVVFQNRFSEPSGYLKTVLANQGLGKLVIGKVSVNWYRTQEYFDSVKWRAKPETAGGGVLMVQAIHYLDLFQWLMGPIVEVIGAKTDTLSLRADVEDTAVATVRFKNGALGTIEASIASFPQFPAIVEIHGTKGTARWEDDFFAGKQSLRLYTKQGEKFIGAERTQSGDIDYPEDEKGTSPAAFQTSEYHRLQIEDFLGAIRENRSPKVDGREGKKVMSLINEIYKVSSNQ